MIAYLVTKARRTWAVEVAAQGKRKATASFGTKVPPTSKPWHGQPLAS